MTTLHAAGGRTVELFIPFDAGNNRRVEAISLGPVTLGHQLDWRDGKYKGAIALLCALAGIPEAVMRQVRFPDVERVYAAFFDLLPSDIRQNIMDGTVPLPPDEPHLDGAEGEAWPDDPAPGSEEALALHQAAHTEMARTRAVGPFDPGNPWGNIRETPNASPQPSSHEDGGATGLSLEP